MWGAASPSAHVTRDAYERIAGDMLARLEAAGPVDGIYLDLHGAMVTEHLDDGEGELLSRVRRLVGDRVPIVASLDLHANVTQAMIKHCDGLVSYRTYPHVDMAASGERAGHLLQRMLTAGVAPTKSFRTLDFLTGLPSQCTLIEPAKSLYAMLARLEPEHDTVLSFTPGFPMADFPECGMAVLGYGPDLARVQIATASLAHAIADAEGEFSMELFTPEAAVSRAMQRGEPGAPVVLADTQDNPGAGGNGDTTGLLAALLARRAPGAVLGLLIDPPSAAKAHVIGAGHKAIFELGEISGVQGHVPLAGEFTIERVADGRFTCTGPMFAGFRMDLGPMAVLEKRRRARGARIAQMPGRGPGNVPPRRHRTEDATHPRAQELGAFSRRLRAHRQGGAGGRRARPGKSGSDDVRVVPAAQGTAPEAAGAGIRRHRPRLSSLQPAV